MRYNTHVVREDDYKIIATQNVKEGYAEGGYRYAVFDGGNLIATGQVSAQSLADSFPVKDVRTTLASVLKRWDK